MTSLLIFNFDGTGNEPEDAEQKLENNVKKEDDNISNILKLHLMMGGNLFANPHNEYGHSTLDAVAKCFYYQGVGTYGGWLRRALNQGVSPESIDVSMILNRALADFSAHYHQGAVVLVTGFSRGAALARRFVSLLADTFESPPSPFVFLCCFDTVASIGLPNLSTRNRPDYDVVFENGCTLSPIVAKALHMVSMDDKRRAFQPTLMNYDEERVLEIWFSGAHSDVGGGYYRDGLSDIALSFAMKWMDRMSKQSSGAVLPKLNLFVPSAEDIQQACPPKLKGVIGVDDLQRNPNPMGKNHQQDRWPIVDWATLDDRVCCVIEDDKISAHLPIIHNAVAERVHRDNDYRPKSLANRSHRVWVDFINEPVVCDNMSAHIHSTKFNWRRLELNEEVEVEVDAEHLYNFTGLMMLKAEKYEITVDDQESWFDASIECDANGWDRDGQSLGLKEIPIKLAEGFRRVPDAHWFALCASVGADDDHARKIGHSSTYMAPTKGELTLFANDLKSKYGNNSGSLTVRIKKVAEATA